MADIWKQAEGITAAFLTRESGTTGYEVRSVTNVTEETDVQGNLEHNRNLLSDLLRWPHVGLAMGGQVHGNRVVCVDRPGVYEGTDGLVTDRPGLAVAVLVADCAAVLLSDPERRVIAAVHAGWRGAAAGIVTKAVEKMSGLGASSANMRAYLSPCISREAFEVGDEVANRFPEEVVDRSYDRPHIDLKQYLERELADNGVGAEHIFRDDRCTVAHSEQLHSYRRDGAYSGRMMATIVIE